MLAAPVRVGTTQPNLRGRRRSDGPLNHEGQRRAEWRPNGGLTQRQRCHRGPPTPFPGAQAMTGRTWIAAFARERDNRCCLEEQTMIAGCGTPRWNRRQQWLRCPEQCVSVNLGRLRHFQRYWR